MALVITPSLHKLLLLFTIVCLSACYSSAEDRDGAGGIGGNSAGGIGGNGAGGIGGNGVAGIVGSALACFNDRYVYTSCQESYRLTAQGAFSIPPQSTEEFCDGPCLEETNLVLKCIDDIMYSFRFYDGASVSDVRYALARGCGHSAGRGDFDVLENFGGGSTGYRGFYGGGGYYYGHGINLVAPKILLLIISLNFILFLL